MTSERMTIDHQPSSHPHRWHGGADPTGPQPTRAARPSRLTVAAGVSLLVIAVLHTLVFAFHPWWDVWLAGPTRTGDVPLEAVVQFWALPGGFVPAGVLLGLLTVGLGRRGHVLPRYVGWGLLVWALACIWVVGPSGFVLVLAPAVLFLLAGRRSPGR